MKSLNIKKAAAVAAGTALLVGAALAAVPDAAKDKAFYWDVNGNTNVQIVCTGGDAVPCGNLAAVIGHMAYTAAGGTTTPDASGEVKIGIMGGAAALPEASVRNDFAWAAGLGATGLTLSSSQGLETGTISFSGNDYDYEEEVTAVNAAFGYNEGTDYHGLGFSSTKPNRLMYKFKFLDLFPDPNGNLNQTVTIPFLGESYVLNKLKTTEAELVKGDEVRLGVGQQSDVTVGDNTYTVTLDSADLDETTTPNTGQATVTVSGGDLSSPVTLQLDTANEQSKMAGNALVFLQSVAKSYTPGQGGSATLRIGGQVLLLKDGQATTEFPDWKAQIVLSGTSISELRLVYNENLQAKAVEDTINGPDDYFQLKYIGDEVARGQWGIDPVTIGVLDTDDAAIDTLTYTDDGYEKTYTIELNDDVNQTAYLAYNTTGFIGTGNVNITRYLNLTEDDIFFVADTPVQISSLSASSAAANAQVVFSVGHGGSNPTTKTVKANDATCVYGPDPYAVCTGVNMIGSNAITFAWTSNASGSAILQVRAGGDWNLNTTWSDQVGGGTIRWGNASINPTFGNYTWPKGLGPLNVTFTDKGGMLWPVFYRAPGGTNPGIISNGINQANSNPGYDSNMYNWTSGAWVEAIDTETVKFWNPESTPRTKRIALIRGEIEGEAGESVTTVTSGDTFPYTVDSTVSVKEFTCTADAVATGVTFGTVAGDFVVGDTVDPAGNAIVIGGHYVNRLAVGMTEGTLTAAGDSMIELSDSTLYVAGYTAADTAAAVNELIAAIKAL